MVNSRDRQSRQPTRWLAPFSLILGLLAAIMLLGAGPGYRWHAWALGSAFGLLRWAAYIGFAAVAVSLVGVALSLKPGRRGALLPAFLGLVLGALVAGLLFSWLQQAKAVPPIHDISTDTSNPPQFVAILPRRANAANSAQYGGAKVAAQQHQAYPDIRPIELQASLARAFKAALASAKKLDWRIIAAVPRQGRIEATDTTFWFGFKDDLVLRIRAAQGGSRVDVRSDSRIGTSDIGKNAARIRTFRRTLKARLARDGQK